MFSVHTDSTQPGVAGYRVHMARVIAIMVAAAALSACASYEAQMRNPQTGETVTCGPFTNTVGNSHVSALQLEFCIDDYQERGFERVDEE